VYVPKAHEDIRLLYEQTNINLECELLQLGSSENGWPENISIFEVPILFSGNDKDRYELKVALLVFSRTPIEPDLRQDIFQLGHQTIVAQILLALQLPVQVEQIKQAAEQRAKDWMNIFAGLKHGFRFECDVLKMCCSKLKEVITNADFQRYIDFIDVSTERRRRFFEFLNHIAYKGLGNERKIQQLLEENRADPKRRLELSEKADFIKFIKEQIKDIEIWEGRPWPELSYYYEISQPICLLEKGAIEYMLYELLTNASSHGLRETITCTIKTKINELYFQIANTPRIEKKIFLAEEDENCGHLNDTYFRIFSEGGIWFCKNCFPQHFKKFFDEECLIPGKGGGSGLGLYLIDFYVKQFYIGSLIKEAKWDPDLKKDCFVSFGFKIPIGTEICYQL
jgi:hypothetical protein